MVLPQDSSNTISMKTTITHTLTAAEMLGLEALVLGALVATV
jgi:hypothetical protein